MNVYCGFVESQGRAWVLIETGFGLGDELTGRGKELAILSGALPVKCEDGQAQREDEESGQDGDGSAAAAPVASDAYGQELSGSSA
jgi:hypothetical protein